MNFKIFKYISLFVLVIGLSACHDGDLPGANVAKSEFGKVYLKSLSVDLTNAENILNNNVGSQASRSSIDMTNFTIQIWDVNENELVNEWPYAEMPEIFELEVGDYKAVVFNNTTVDADFEAPYFFGESPFTITLNHVTDVDKVVCKLANIKVSIRYEKGLYDLLQDDAKVTVSCGSSSLLFKKDENRSGYFKANSDRLFVRFEGTINGQVETNFLDLSDVAPGQHRIITYSIKNLPVGPGNETGFVDPNGISIDTDVENEDLTTTVSNSEDPIPDHEEPGKEDPKDDPNKDPNTDPDPPTPPADNTIEITAVDPLSFDHPNVVQDDYSTGAIVQIKAPNGISSFKVKIESTSSAFLDILEEVDVPTEFDLTDPGSYDETFTGFGFPIRDAVKGKTELDFDLSQLLPLLKLGDGFPGTHSFILTISDSKGKSATKTLVMTL